MSDAIEIPKAHSIRSKALGDFQTPLSLTQSVCKLVKTNNYKPTLLIEPSCGKGNFVISALKVFPSINTVLAIEVQTSHKEEFFSELLALDIDLSSKNIIFLNESFFEIDFEEIFKEHNINILKESILILGNPPWVTNSFLGTIKLKNLPLKTNKRIKLKGLDALTGKSNFDIAEFFILHLLDIFKSSNFLLSMICKTSTVQNMFKNYKSSLINYSIKSFIIDSKKEFDISASANILFIENLFKVLEEPVCSVYAFDDPCTNIYSYGYKCGNFVSNVNDYIGLRSLDGKFSLQWRQGLKHDASSVLVLEKISDGLYKNKLQEEIHLENNLIYPLVKSSDLKSPIIQQTKYSVIVTQKKIGENTENSIRTLIKTWEYLESKIDFFTKRKSSIYRNQPKFAQFGIGEYSFKPFKIAVSGFYKKLQFSILLPVNKKPIMLDDTCYSLSFDSLHEAVFIWLLLTTIKAKKFFKSIVFSDNKRPYKKDVLQRLNLQELLKITSDEELNERYKELEKYNLPLSFQEVLALKKNFMFYIC